MAKRGTPTDGALSSANARQTITLHGTGFTAQTQIAFPTLDSTSNPDVKGTRIVGPSQVATSINTRVVSGCTSLRAPPMIPAIEVGPSASSITTISSSRLRICSSSVCTGSPWRARLTTSRPPATRSRSNACSGCPVASIT